MVAELRGIAEIVGRTMYQRQPETKPAAAVQR
jgi:hypothetical protein